MIVQKRGPAVLAAVAAVTAALSLSGCLSTVDPTAGGDPCWAMAQPSSAAAGESTGTTHAILIDRSGSTVAEDSAEFVPDWAKRLGKDVPVNGGDRYLIVPFAGERFLSWPDQPLVAPPIRGTAKKQGELRRAVIDCIEHSVRQTALKKGVSRRTDVLGALHAAGEQLAVERGGAKDIYVATDGYASKGCARLKIGKVLSDDDIARIVEGCHAELPRNLSGVPVHIVGIGTSSSKMREASPVAIASVGRLWEALCRQITETCSVRTGAPSGDAADPSPQATRPEREGDT
ncbi:hypothetical protein GCM10027203_17020 [Nonomuraea fastidiosa]